MSKLIYVLMFILKSIPTILTLGLNIYLKDRKKIEALIVCIDKAKSNNKSIIDGVKDGTIKIGDALTLLDPEKLDDNFELVQSSFGLAKDIKKDVEKFIGPKK